jgi:hypothetical protein
VIRPHRMLTCRSTSLIAAALVTVLVVARERSALGQACCAGGALVTPARLALHEDYGVGLQVRARSNVGSFDTAGHYTSSQGAEEILEQDFATSIRFPERGQVSVMLPTVQTHRHAGALDEWGGGVGDLAITGRYDFLLSSEALYWPGIGLLAGVTFPTGTPPDMASKPLSTDATGAGTYDATLGVSIEKVHGNAYAAVNGWLTHRFTRTVAVPGVGSLHESFGLRWTILAVGGYVFQSEAALALYVNVLGEGDATVNGTRDPATSLRLTTAGAAAVLPFHDVWRIQGAIFSDVMISWFGRNEVAGAGLSASLIRVWL